MSGPLRRSVSRLAAQPEAASEPAVAAEHDGVPAREGRAKPLAELPVDGLGLVAEPLAVGGVGGEQAARRRRLGLEPAIGLLERDQAVQSGAGDEVARHVDGPGVAVGAAITASGRAAAERSSRRCAARAPLRPARSQRAFWSAAPAQKAERRRGGLRVPSPRRRVASARSSPGATSAAISAASIGSVPEPHSGSSRLPPAAASRGHAASSRMPAARFSLSGASTCTRRRGSRAGAGSAR